MFVLLAETEPDLRKARECLNEAETSMFFRSLELVNSLEGHDESKQLHAAADRLLRVKSEKLKWPEPHLKGAWGCYRIASYKMLA
jgi:hypothetical protein